MEELLSWVAKYINIEEMLKFTQDIEVPKPKSERKNKYDEDRSSQVHKRPRYEKHESSSKLVALKYKTYTLMPIGGFNILMAI